MIKIKIQNIKSGQLYGANFSTNLEADEWILKQTELKSWGESTEDFTIERFDLTVEENEKKQVKKVEDEQELGQSIRNLISSLIRKKLIDRLITIDQLEEFVELDSVKKVERYLDNGYITLSKKIITNSDFSPFITSEEKQDILKKLK